MSELVCPKDGVQTVLRRSAEGGEEDRLLGRTLGGRFRVEGAVGKGGFATVYVATQLSMGRQVALKALHPDLITDDEQLQRFFREARAASRIASPHVVRIHDFGVDDDTGTPFIAMELIEGITLAKELRGGARCPSSGPPTSSGRRPSRCSRPTGSG